MNMFFQIMWPIVLLYAKVLSPLFHLWSDKRSSCSQILCGMQPSFASCGIRRNLISDRCLKIITNIPLLLL
uniref:Uncharacterized protein n=1 Tax=Rhizophora mucronata TaxID=61149 RepID=A0A2P2JCI5_RHIMU